MDGPATGPPFGITTDACVLATACEIHVRDLKLFVPSDCVAATRPEIHKMALELMTQSFDAHITPSSRLNLRDIAKVVKKAKFLFPRGTFDDEDSERSRRG